MGLYKQARLIIEQSRKINEELEAHRGLGYALGNLGYIYLVTGDLRKARQTNEQALQEISLSQDARGKVNILTGLGFVLLAMGDATGASRRFGEARQLAFSHGFTALTYEAITGLAACAVMQGQLDEAREYVHKVWDYLKEHGWVGMDNPRIVYRSCAETFDALGDVKNFRAVIASGHQALMEVADTINVPEWRKSFLENVPDNRAIIEMWERGIMKDSNLRQATTI
jgi:tetratricopeptide (TPR) repeat protein